MNGASLHALDVDKRFPNLATGTFFGRALFNHRRAPQKNSMKNLHALLSAVSSDALHAFVSGITKEFSSVLVEPTP